MTLLMMLSETDYIQLYVLYTTAIADRGEKLSASVTMNTTQKQLLRKKTFKGLEIFTPHNHILHEFTQRGGQ